MENILYFCGVDEWNRPVFKRLFNNLYYCDTDHLFRSGVKEDEIIERYKQIGTSTICYKGKWFNSEPEGGGQRDYEIVTKEEAKTKFGDFLTRMFTEETEQHKEFRKEHKKKFFERVGDFNYVDEVDNPKHIRKGDLVIVRNGYDIPVGPFEVLGFEDDIKDKKLFLDWDCYWVTKSISKVLTIITKL
jgi:hypothetical protein